MKIEVYPNTLPPAAMTVRTTVFVEEQGFTDEYDDIDGIAVHFVMYDDKGHPVATCRLFPQSGPNEEKIYFLGRLAVMKGCRGQGLGAEMLRAAEAYAHTLGARELRLHSQVAAEGFYRTVGYEAEGDIDDEQGCPHVWMKKRLKEATL